MSNQSLEELANGLFDEMGFKEGDELTFNKNQYMNQSEPIEDSESHGEQEKNTDSSDKKEERLYAGQFKTVEELEAAFNSKQEEKPVAKQPEPENKSEAIPDLTREELITLHETDDQDGKDFTVQYLKKKMQDRDLTDFELEKLKELDSGGNDLYGSYVSLKTRRDVMAELKPTIEPIREQQNKEAYEKYVESEKAILSTLDNEYQKEELASLKQKTSDPKFVEEVLNQSEVGEFINNLWQSGQKAKSYKLLIGEAKRYLSKQAESAKQEKREKSFPADVGSSADARKKISAKSIEEAFNDSMQELNY